MQYTTNYSLKKPQYADEADIEVINDNTDDVDTLIHQNRTMIAPAFDNTKAYVTGDPVEYLGALYVFIADKAAGAWDASKVEPTTAAEMGGGGTSALADLDDVEITSPTQGQALLFDDDVWKNQDLPDHPVTKEASGNPIEVSDSASAPLVKCTTAITGSQDLHGYDKPWVGGAGKNKLPLVLADIKSANTSGTWNGNACTLNGVTFTIETDGDDNILGIAITGTSTNITYFILDSNFDSTTYSGYIISGLPTYGSAQTYLMRITSQRSFVAIQDVLLNNTEIVDNGNGLRLSIRIAENYAISSSGITFYPMLRASGTTADFAPYSNICPITAYNQSTISVEDENEVVQQTSTATFSNSIYQGNADFVGSKATATWGYIASYNGETLPGEWISSMDEYAPGTTPTTGAQVAYELASSTEETITPSNLPIKSLSGYTHIESSTGEMEIEYITKGEQALVDLIEKSDRIYSTQEQVVGTWVDGKTLYEKTLTFTTGAANTYVQVAHNISNVDTIWCTADSFVTHNGFTFFLSAYTGASYDNDFVGLVCATTFDYQVGVNLAGEPAVVTLRYTKTSSNRSLSKGGGEQEVKEEPTEETKEEPKEETKEENENNEAER